MQNLISKIFNSSNENKYSEHVIYIHYLKMVIENWKYIFLNGFHQNPLKDLLANEFLNYLNDIYSNKKHPFIKHVELLGKFSESSLSSLLGSPL